MPSGKSIRSRMEAFETAPKFSILMPVFNTEPKWLERAVESVFRQVYPHWELCITDDASTRKETVRYLDSLSHARIQIKRLERNLGIAGASNAAAAMAAGEYVAFLDHDDEITEDALFEMATETPFSNPTGLRICCGAKTISAISPPCGNAFLKRLAGSDPVMRAPRIMISFYGLPSIQPGFITFQRCFTDGGRLRLPQRETPLPNPWPRKADAVRWTGMSTVYSGRPLAYSPAIIYMCSMSSMKSKSPHGSALSFPRKTGSIIWGPVFDPS
ncbi:MAG: glycosyltransferase [Deltaproteobacteria bacterium]|nr:glycosyltransferase [Deltaproteobacteria bacterium]